jgi:hypothetical protein
MLTAKDALEWVTRRPAPPWRVSELRSALRANPAQTFSLKQAITGLEGQTCLLAMGIRDASLIQTSGTFQEFQSAFNASTPSRETLVSVISYLGTYGAAITYLSNDWKTAAVRSTLGNLRDFGGIVITASNWTVVKSPADPAAKLSTGAVVKRADPAGTAIGVLELVAPEPIPMFIVLVGIAQSLTDADSTLDYVNSVGDAVPQSSAGGDTSVGSGSGSDVLDVGTVTITGTFQGEDLNFLIDAAPLDDADIPDAPGDSDGDDGSDDDGSGDGGGGDGGGGGGG